MKALKDFQDERLSKREMGNVVGGTWFSCKVEKSDGSSYVYHRDFSSTAEMYGWIQQILSSPDVTKAECANSDSFHGTFGDGMDVVHP